MKKKLAIVGGLIAALGCAFLLWLAFQTDEILLREDIRIMGDREEVHAWLEDVRNWHHLHARRANREQAFSENTTGAGAWWRQNLARGPRTMTIESSSLAGGIKFKVDWGAVEPLECHMAVREHLNKGLIFVRSARGRVSFFERLRRKHYQRLMRQEFLRGNEFLQEQFGVPKPGKKP